MEQSNCSFTYARDGSDDSARRCSGIICQAEPVTMGHLKSGSGNANGHFGSATPEAFVLSEKADYTNQAYSLKHSH